MIALLNVALLAAVIQIEAPFGTYAVEVPEFPAKDFDISAYGARADGSKSTEAFAAAMAACEKAGGGRVVVPKGTWLTGAVRFRSGCNLHLEEGATLEFTDDPADYPEVHTTWEGIECYNHSPLLFAYGVTNVAITGKGTIAPRMDFWRTWFARPQEHMAATEQLYYWCSTNAPMSARRLLALKDAHMRPHLIQFNRCGNVLLEDFKIRESPFWMIHLYHSENCVVRRLDTYAHGHNNDGVDVDMTKNVLIENCRFDQGDDGVVLKAGRNADGWRLNRSTENVVVRDCDMGSCHSLLGVGSELSGGVRNVWMTRCTVSDTYAMLRIKTGPRRGGFVENVWMDHCRGSWMIQVFSIVTDYCAQWGAFPDFELRWTRIRNINVSDCEAELAGWGLQLKADRLSPTAGIRVRNVRIERVVHQLTDIRNCSEVSIDGLSLAPEPTDPVSARLFFAGDSTLDDGGQSLGGKGRYPYQSWGTTLRQSMREGCDVVNYAKSGASTKSFLGSGVWKNMMMVVRPGDFVAIQFGHNDQKRSTEFYLKERWADPKGLFRENVRRMVGDVREMGAIPILLSPICRGTFDAEGKRLIDPRHEPDGVCLGSYREAMCELAKELDCDYVDMNGLTRELMERIGRNESMKFFVVSTGFKKGKDGEPSKDTTHPCEAGAEAFARLFIQDVTARDLPVAKLFEFRSSCGAKPSAARGVDIKGGS